MSEEPNEFFSDLSEIKQILNKKEVFVFLDYDGTLTPIVATPDLAVISEEMRKIVHTISLKCKTAIVSGRATDDVRGKVKIDGIFYAGSHGFEIVDPDGNVHINDEAKKIKVDQQAVHEKLSERLKNVKGSLVEDVKYTISVHYRLVADEDFPKIELAVDEILNEYPNFRKTHGKKVFEVRPRIDWDKGKAVDWILNVLDYDRDRNLAIYIGDDTTDEDAFAVLDQKGFGILVAEQPRATKAKYMIRNTDDVKKVLEFLINEPVETGI